MIRCNFHTHTTYCDGKHSPEEVVLSAIEKGMDVIGFSGHSYVDFDDCCMSEENTKLYIKEIRRLKEKYADQITVFCGLEKDYYSPAENDDFDYIIGSVHYLKIGDQYLTVDNTLDILKDGINRYFDQDPLKLAETYYEYVGNVARKTGCDIIGHFDLVTKFNEIETVIDTSNPRYISAWKKAVDKLLPYGIPFEINTGAISRGYRGEAYPSKDIREYIKEKGGSFILSSDSHHKDTLLQSFDEYEKELQGYDATSSLITKLYKSL